MKNDLQNELWRVGLATFAQIAGTSKNWIAYKWLRYVARRIEEAIHNGNGRLIICAPPRHGKSNLLSHWLPTWFLDWMPEKRVILASYGDTLANDWGKSVRNEFQTNPLLRTKIRQDDEKASAWRTIEGGSMRTVGVGSGITGFGCDLSIIDDPIRSYQDAMSATSRKTLIDWFNSVLMTRLEPNATVILTQTRWHESDLAGFLLSEHNDKWELISFPAICESENDLLGRAIGDPLCPERFDLDRLNEIKSSMPGSMWASLYQQRPGPVEGSILLRSQIKHWENIPDDLTSHVLSFDLTFVEGGSSYAVGQCWARHGSSFYLLDQVRAKPDFTGQIEMILDMKRRWPQAQGVLIENAANGHAAISVLQNRIPGIIPIQPLGSKTVRLMSISPLFEAGNVLLPPNSQNWVKDFVEEIVNFPGAANDDQCDCMSQALFYLSQKPELIYEYHAVFKEKNRSRDLLSFDAMQRRNYEADHPSRNVFGRKKSVW